jgi:adenine-specific DNA-methyltransferase
LPESGWTLVNDSVQKLLEKIKSKGDPLGEYVNGKIFYGIKTGFNEAFVIDAETRDRMIAEDPKSTVKLSNHFWPDATLNDTSNRLAISF